MRCDRTKGFVMKRLLYLFIMASSFGVMANDIGAPFGFEWGQSYHEINKKSATH